MEKYGKYLQQLFKKNLRQITKAWYEMERKFWYGIWKMPEWNGIEDFKNGMENIFHTTMVISY